MAAKAPTPAAPTVSHALRAWGLTLAAFAASYAAVAMLAAPAADPPTRPRMLPAMSVQVFDHGAPASKAALIRSYDWRWGEASGSQRAVSNELGRALFPELRASMIFGVLIPHQPLIEQSLSVGARGKYFVAWSRDAHGYADPRDAKTLSLRCDIEGSGSDEHAACAASPPLGAPRTLPRTGP